MTFNIIAKLSAPSRLSSTIRMRNDDFGAAALVAPATCGMDASTTTGQPNDELRPLAQPVAAGLDPARRASPRMAKPQADRRLDEDGAAATDHLATSHHDPWPASFRCPPCGDLSFDSCLVAKAVVVQRTSLQRLAVRHDLLVLGVLHSLQPLRGAISADRCRACVLVRRGLERRIRDRRRQRMAGRHRWAGMHEWLTTRSDSIPQAEAAGRAEFNSSPQGVTTVRLIHVVFFDRHEQRLMLEALARNFPPILETHPAALRLPHADRRLRLAHRQLPRRGDADVQELPDDVPVAPVAWRTYLKFDWNTPHQFRELFKARLFDYLGKLDIDGQSRVVHPAVPVRQFASRWSTPTPPGASCRSRRRARATSSPTSGA